MSTRCHALADRIALRLEGFGHQVGIACDGQAPLVVVGSLRPETVLLEANMGHVGGYNVVRWDCVASWVVKTFQFLP